MYTVCVCICIYIYIIYYGECLKVRDPRKRGSILNWFNLDDLGGTSISGSHHILPNTNGGLKSKHGDFQSQVRGLPIFWILLTVAL